MPSAPAVPDSRFLRTARRAVPRRHGVAGGITTGAGPIPAPPAADVKVLPMKLRDFVVDQAVLPALAAPTRDAALDEMLDALIAAGAVDADLHAPLSDLLLAREKNGSTGFGKGVAVPHVKHPGVKKMCAAVAVSGPGVDFNALDKQPVYTLFMLVSPSGKPDQHLQAMETLFSNLQKDNFRSFLRQADTAAAVLDLLDEADRGELG